MTTASRKTILVTGGAGFIGSHQCRDLLAQGYRVRVIDNLISGDRSLVPAEAEFIEADICDRSAVFKACEGVSGVIHLAAMSKVGPSMDVPDLCVNTNVNGTMNLLMAALELKIPSFVYAGSSTYYGLGAPPNRLESLPDCLNPYAASKYMGEILVNNFFRSYQLPTMIMRYFNVYGPQQPSTGPYALVLGIFLERELSGQPLLIHGDGLQKRDFIHVRDVVRANRLAMEKLWTTPSAHHTLNIGSGTNLSIIDLAKMISSNYQFTDRRKGDAMETLADISETTRALGWKPEIRFEDGFLELKDVYRKKRLA
jgi:nucleoside-diphosphate-sugar epimerase